MVGRQAHQECDMAVESLALRAFKHLLCTDRLQNKGTGQQLVVDVTAVTFAMHPGKFAGASALGSLHEVTA